MQPNRKINILVVDDSSTLRNGISRYLSTSGYQSIAASSMEEALKFIQDTTIHLVVTDIIMPGMGGMSGILQIREKWPEIGIIAMSAGGSQIDGKNILSAARQVGADEILEKPFTKDRLFASLEKLIAHYSEKGRARNILVIDDSSTIRKILCDGLSRSGFRCSSADSIEQALESQDVAGLDLIVCDIFMPGVGGLAGIAQITMDWPKVKIIAISGGHAGMGSEAILVAAQTMGAHDFMKKPFQIPELVSKINALIESPQENGAVAESEPLSAA